MIDGHDDQPRLGAAEMDLPVAVTGLRENRDPVAVAQTSLVKRVGQPAGALVGVPPGEVRLATRVGRVSGSGDRLPPDDLREVHSGLCLRSCMSSNLGS